MNGYIQIDLGGELRSLKFNMYAIEIIAEKGNTSPIGNLAVFIYAGLCGNAFVKSAGSDAVCKETFENIFEWAEDIFINRKEVFEQVLNAFYEGKTKIEQTGEDKKKVKKK